VSPHNPKLSRLSWAHRRSTICALHLAGRGLACMSSLAGQTRSRSPASNGASFQQLIPNKLQRGGSNGPTHCQPLIWANLVTSFLTATAMADRMGSRLWQIYSIITGLICPPSRQWKRRMTGGTITFANPLVSRSAIVTNLCAPWGSMSAAQAATSSPRGHYCQTAASTDGIKIVRASSRQFVTTLFRYCLSRWPSCCGPMVAPMVTITAQIN